MTTPYTGPTPLDAEERAWLNWEGADAPRSAWHAAWQQGRAQAKAEDAPLVEALMLLNSYPFALASCPKPHKTTDALEDAIAQATQGKE